MAKKKSTSKPKTSEAASSSTSQSSVKQKKTMDKAQSLLALVLVLTVINSLLLLGLIFSGGAGDSSKVNDISAKVDALDNFFGTYVDGYVSPGSGSAAPMPNQPAPGQPSTPTNLDPSIEGNFYLGDVNAPVTVVEFSDFRCSFCQRFYSQSFAQLKSEYVDTGLVRFVYKDFPVVGGQEAAIAARCVGAQGGNEMFFDYHDVVFDRQQMISSANLRSWAEDFNINMDQFDSCLQDPSSLAAVQADLAEGQRLGISGTPSFIINGELVVGAQPFSVIKQVIDSKLN